MHRACFISDHPHATDRIGIVQKILPDFTVKGDEAVAVVLPAVPPTVLDDPGILGIIPSDEHDAVPPFAGTDVKRAVADEIAFHLLNGPREIIVIRDRPRLKGVGAG